MLKFQCDGIYYRVGFQTPCLTLLNARLGTGRSPTYATAAGRVGTAAYIELVLTG